MTPATVPFAITAWWKPLRPASPFDPSHGLAGASPLFVALRHFLALYEGEFVVRVGDLHLRFDLRPDLSTVFEDLPGVLTALAADTAAAEELYFFEQGTDVAFLLERKGEVVTIRFRRGLTAGWEFDDLPEGPLAVAAGQFIGEWVLLARRVLQALVALEPGLDGDDSYRRYRGQLDLAEAAAGGEQR